LALSPPSSILLPHHTLHVLVVWLFDEPLKTPLAGPPRPSPVIAPPPPLAFHIRKGSHAQHVPHCYTPDVDSFFTSIDPYVAHRYEAPRMTLWSLPTIVPSNWFFVCGFLAFSYNAFFIYLHGHPFPSAITGPVPLQGVCQFLSLVPPSRFSRSTVLPVHVPQYS